VTVRYTILVVEDNPVTRKMVRVTLAAEGYRVLEAPDGRTALELMAEVRPDLVLMDLILPGVDGFELVTRLRALPGGADIPILACSGFLSRFEATRMSALGFADFLMKPVEPSRLVRTVRNFLPIPSLDAEGAGGGRHVLAVDDDPVQLKLLQIHLAQMGFRVTTAQDGAGALEQARRSPPDAILSDVLMPRLDGFQLTLALRRDPRLAHIPVVLVSSNYLEEADRALARKVGASGLAPRSPDCKDAIHLLLASLQEQPPLPQGSSEVLEEEHTHRMVRQLERQVAQNSGLIQRSSFQAAVLSMLATLSSGLAQRLEMEVAPIDVLASLLDVGGLSLGALYLYGPDGRLRLEAHHGYSAEDAEALGDLCGHPELLQVSTLEGVPVSIPGSVSPPMADDFLTRAGVKSALLVPLGSRGEPIGALLLGSRIRDLADSDWRPFAQSVGGQISQTIALSRAFSRLTAAEERYRALFEHALEGIYQSSPAGALLLANPALARILGYESPEELAAMVSNFGAQIHVDPDRRAEFMGRLETEGVVSGFEARFRRKDGRVIWISENARAVSDASGRLAYIEGRVEDISRRREAEEVLRESEERFRGAFEESATGMALQGLDGRYLRVNRALCQMLGYSAEDMLATSVQTMVHPDDRDVDLAHDSQMLAGEIRSYQTEKRYVHKLGREVLVLATVSLVHDAPGRPLYFVVQAQDITGRRAAAAIQARLQAQLAQTEKLAAMGQLLAGVAHELNNPLAVVLGQSSLLASQLETGVPAERARKLGAAAERCARIVKNFLALARQQPPTRQAVLLNTVVREAIELLAYSLRVDGITPMLDLARDLPLLSADPHQLHQVIVNLVTNAHHAMRETVGPRTLTVSTRFDAASARVRLDVADTGPGIAPEVQARLFEPFFTTKPPGQGTGLGLSLCRGIVEEHGGEIRVESAPGRGAAFQVELPVTQVRAAATPTPSRSSPRECRILVVDDEPTITSVLADMLGLDGHVVDTASTGRAALDRLRERSYDLILSDLRMPELDGPGFYREAEHRHPGVSRRFVFLTGDVLNDTLRRFLEETGVPSVSKPFTLAEIRQAIRQVLPSAGGAP
jgi:PAS domain S-box-containing protein